LNQYICQHNDGCGNRSRESLGWFWFLDNNYPPAATLFQVARRHVEHVLNFNASVIHFPFHPLPCEESGSLDDGWFEAMIQLIANKMSSRHGTVHA